MITNDKYKEQYEFLHARQRFRGYQVAKFQKEIRELIVSLDALTILDYGCGKADGYWRGRIHINWGSPIPALYDPYLPVYAKRPEGEYDIVICCDVLEHVPEDDIPDLLEDIFNYATKGVFLTVALFPAKKTLPNGENPHCTLKPKEWWEERIADANKYKELTIWTEYRDKA